MTQSKSVFRTFLGVALLTAAGNGVAQEVGPECRGVAAGVVAAMKSSGEISGNEAAQAAIIAARRACSVALDGELGTGAGNTANSTSKQQTTASKDSEDEDSSMWDFLTRDRANKDGHDRLRRLKTQ